MCVIVSMFVCALHTCLVLREPRKASYFLELKLQTVVSYHVDAGN